MTDAEDRGREERVIFALDIGTRSVTEMCIRDRSFTAPRAKGLASAPLTAGVNRTESPASSGVVIFAARPLTSNSASVGTPPRATFFLSLIHI